MIHQLAETHPDIIIVPAHDEAVQRSIGFFPEGVVTFVCTTPGIARWN